MKNFFHTLGISKRLRLPNEFIFFDTETYENKVDDEKHLTLKLGWAIYYNRLDNRKEYFYFDDSVLFWDYVIGKCKIDDNIVLFAHNADFDFKVVNGYDELFIKRKFKVENLHIEGNIFLLEAYNYGKTIFIYDTMNYIPKSLKYIGTSIGLPKIDINDFGGFEKCSKADLSDYCKNDVEICYKLVLIILDFLLKNDLGSFRPTSAGLAFEAFRHRFYDKDRTPIFIHLFKQAIRLERNSYKGGITDVFKYGKYTNDLIKLDINSMYPYIMKNKKICYSLVHMFADDENLKEKMFTHLKDYDVIAEMDIFLPEEYAYILTRFERNKEIKCGFIEGKFKATLCTPEIEFVIKYGKILKVYEYAIYERDYIFKDFVDFFYNSRLEYDKNKNTAFSLLCKLFLNSLYGKFAQKRNKNETFDIDDISPAIFKMPKIIGTDFTLMQIGDKIIKTTKSDENGLNSLVAISSMITSYARMYIVEILLKIGRENVYYMDTDCIICNKNAINKINDYIDFDNKKILGKLKIEGETNKAIFYRPKFYSFGKEFKCKGVKKTHKVIIDDDINFEIEQENFERFKTSIRKGSIDYVRVSTVIKKMNKVYDKGIINKDNTIKPFNIKDVKLV